MRFPSFCYSCVKLVLAHRLHLGGPRGITITNVYVHMLPCKRDSQSRHSRLSSLFYLLSTPSPQPTTGETEKGEQGRRHILPKPDCKQMGLLMLSVFTVQKVSVLVPGVLWTSPQLGPQPQHPSNMWVYESIWWWITLDYNSHLWMIHLGLLLECIWRYNETVD